MTPLDWVIFLLILAITLAAVVYGNILKIQNKSIQSKEASFLDLMIMGRQLTLPMFIATLVATWYGGIFGVTKIAFEQGIFNFVTQGVFWYASYLVFAFFVIGKVARYNAITLPDLIDKMFGPKSARLAAVFNFFNVLPIVYVISLGLFIQLLFGGELWVCMLLGVMTVVLYTLFGGFRAIVFSDLVQFIVMCSGVFLVLLYSYLTYGGMDFLRQGLPASYFSLTGTEGLATTLAWGLIAMATLVDPNFYQRVFAAKSKTVARKGIIISTLIWILFDICTTGGAMYAKAVIPDANSQNAYLVYALQILPEGVRGFVLAGILATILSTIDSYLFIAGTTVSFDMMPKKIKGSIPLYHVGIVLVGMIAVAMGLLFEGNIKAVWKTLGSYSAGCMLVPVLYGYIFPQKIRDNQFVFACLLGVVGITIWRNITLTGFWVNIDELYIGIIATSFGLAIWSFVSNTYEKER